MDDEARRAVLATSIRLAASDDYRDRADAGRILAVLADLPETREPLIELIAFDANTFPTLVITEALARRHDATGLAVIAAALGVANRNHADYIDQGVHEVFLVYGDQRDAAVRRCEALTRDPDARVRRGAESLIETLTGWDTILVPAEKPE